MKNILSILFIFTFSFLIISCTKANKDKKDPLLAGQNEIEEVLGKTAKLGEKQAAEMKELVGKFHKESDEFEKFKLCQNIALGSMSQSLKAIIENSKEEGDEKEDSEDKFANDVKEAQKFCKAINNRIQSFEKRFSQQDWESIGEDVKKSYIHKTHRFLSAKPQCSKERLTKLINSDQKAFQSTGSIANLMTVINSREHLNMPEYLPRYRMVVESKNHADKGLVLKYIDEFGKKAIQKKQLDNTRKYLATKLQNLLSEGITNVDEVINTALDRAPGCFSAISMPAIDYSRVILTEKKMSAWQNYFKGNKNNVVALLDSPGEKGWRRVKYDKEKQVESLSLHKNDEYGRPLLFKVNEGELDITSTGRDRKFSEDDITI